MIRKGSLEERFTATGNHSGYEIQLRHDGLNEIKHLFARDTDVLDGKIHNQEVAWHKKWRKHLELKEKEKLRLETSAKSGLAEERTERAIQALTQIEKILSHTLAINDAVDWKSIKNTTPYTENVGRHGFIQFDASSGRPLKSNKKRSPQKPEKQEFFPPVSFFKTILGQKKKILLEQEGAYRGAISVWECEKQSINEENNKREAEFKLKYDEWKKRECEYLDKQKVYNNKIDKLRESYASKDEEAIEEY